MQERSIGSGLMSGPGLTNVHVNRPNKRKVQDQPNFVTMSDDRDSPSTISILPKVSKVHNKFLSGKSSSNGSVMQVANLMAVPQLIPISMRK